MVWNTPQAQTKRAAIVCNGPSLRGLDLARELKNYVTFGMNLAYRHWDTVGWYPDYYSCLDRVVGMAHTEDIGRLVNFADAYGIRGFLLRHNVVAALGLQNHTLVHDFDALVAEDASFFRGYWCSTGSQTAAWAAMLGFRRLILLGADASYIKYVEGAVHVDELVLKIEEQPARNPNYFFDDYQRCGDVYHVPMREHPDFPHEDQLMGWHMIRPALQRTQTLVINASPQSHITAFPRCRFEDVARAFTHARRREARASCRSPLSDVHTREAGTVLHTAEMIAEMCSKNQKNPAVAVDVGACQGMTALPFLRRGWQVYAVEADPTHVRTLENMQVAYPRLHVSQEAMSCVAGRNYPWFHHKKYPHLHAMKGFSTDYAPAGNVTTTTLRAWCEIHTMPHIDVLFCDVVGFELMVLRGMDFEKSAPDCVVCAWSDIKSLHLGSDMHDIGSFLLACGYHVYMSEWHPELKPSLPQQWKHMRPYPADPEHHATWGHFLAFRGRLGGRGLHERLRQALERHVVVGAAVPPHPLPPLPNQGRIPYAIHY